MTFEQQPRTIRAKNRLAEDPRYTRVGNQDYFSGRPMIGHDTTINGGVYVGATPREAIVVDDKNSSRYQKAYQDFLDTFGIPGKLGMYSSAKAATSAMEVAASYLGGQGINFHLEEEVQLLISAKTNGQPSSDIKIDLSVFMKAGKGVCRHRALLAGYLLERMIHEGKLQAKVSVDRNEQDKFGAHAWVRLMTDKGIVIVDPQLGYVGSINNPKAPWDYRRQGDYVRE